jgi:hypothetical protein
LRVEGSKKAGENRKVVKTTNGTGCVQPFSRRIDEFVSGAQGALEEIQHPPVMKALKDLIGREQGFGVFEWCVLEAGLQFCAGVARGQFQRNGLSHNSSKFKVQSRK